MVRDIVVRKYNQVRFCLIEPCVQEPVETKRRFGNNDGYVLYIIPHSEIVEAPIALDNDDIEPDRRLRGDQRLNAVHIDAEIRLIGTLTQHHCIS